MNGISHENKTNSYCIYTPPPPLFVLLPFHKPHAPKSTDCPRRQYPFRTRGGPNFRTAVTEAARGRGMSDGRILRANFIWKRRICPTANGKHDQNYDLPARP